MKAIDRIRRQKLIQTAEGYLDLIMAFDDLWPLELPHRVALADRALEALQQIKRPMGHKPYILFLKGPGGGTILRSRQLSGAKPSAGSGQRSCLVGIGLVLQANQPRRPGDRGDGNG